MTKIRTRFAPSPTGRMHVGNLRTALYAYLIAKHEGGDFILRIEDTDQERFVEGAVEIINRTLEKTGLIHDEGPDKDGGVGPYVQSQRQAEGIYLEYARKLIEKGEAYYCFCDKERLATLNQVVAGKEINVYDKHCLSLSKEEVAQKLASGIPYVIRQNNPTEGTTTFCDEIYGDISVDNAELANQVIRENKSRFAKTILPLREGGRVSFQFRESRKEEELCLLSDIQKLSYEDLITSAVILRTNLEAFQYASLLKQNGVAVRQAGPGKEDALHHFIMEDCLSFLRFCREGNRRKDFLRFMNKQNLFLSRQALLGEIVTKQELVSYYRNDLQMCDKIDKLFDNIRIASGLSPALTIHLFRKIIGYDAYLKEKATGRAEKEHYMETADQLEDLFKLMKPQETCDHFFSRMEEGREEDAKKGAVHPGISVITMHGAKGLEFTSVFLPDLNEGVIPGKNARTPSAIEEERRLLYVAITRARDFLYLYCTRERNRKPTRFLERVSLPH